MIALDASALLAFLFREEGHESVARHLDDCVISTVNLSEVLGHFARDGHDPRAILRRLEEGPFHIVPFTAIEAARAAAFVPLTSSLGLSLGDRACLALAQNRGIRALTADRSWIGLDVGIPIEVIR